MIKEFQGPKPKAALVKNLEGAFPLVADSRLPNVFNASVEMRNVLLFKKVENQ